MPKVLILTASVGEGHISHAKALATIFEKEGYDTSICDILNLNPKWANILNNVYKTQVVNLPILYRFFYWWSLYFKFPLRVYAFILHIIFAQSLRECLIANPPDLIIGNHPYLAQLVPNLQKTELQDISYITYLVDLNAHPLWLSRHTKTYICTSEITKKKILRHFPKALVTVAPPLVRPEFLDRLSSAPSTTYSPSTEPSRDYNILLTAGSWGTGSVFKIAKRLSSKKQVKVTVLCGHNTKLISQIAKLPNCKAIPWTDDILSYFQTADLVIQNAGGASAYEALATGTPVVTYRPLPGHGKDNAKTLNKLGWIPYIKRFSKIPTSSKIFSYTQKESLSLTVPPSISVLLDTPRPNKSSNPFRQLGLYSYRLKEFFLGLGAYFLLSFGIPHNHSSPAILEHAVRFIVHLSQTIDKDHIVKHVSLLKFYGPR
jgi:UDP-N-acetylglucosamine:LPS N-acetylglucosamine transferase